MAVPSLGRYLTQSFIIAASKLPLPCGSSATWSCYGSRGDRYRSTARAVAQLPFALQMAAPSITLLEIIVLMGLAFLLTRRRVTPDMAARAPERRVALRETLIVLAYAALGQVGGWIMGPALGYRPFSFHIAGTVFGCSVPPKPTEVWMWATYNFVIFAIVPYLYFRRRYTNTQLNLHSTNRGNDALVIMLSLSLNPSSNWLCSTTAYSA